MAPLKGELGAKRSEGLSPKGPTNCERRSPLTSPFSYLFIKKGVFPLDCNALKCYDGTTEFERGSHPLLYLERGLSNMKKKLLAALLAGVMAVGLTACGGNTSTDAPAADGEANGDSAAGSYTVGVCQLVQHAALDAATQGFQDKLTELIEADGGTVTFDVKNASGESANCASIINGFVSSGVDLILANATASLQAAQAGTTDIPILGTAVTDYGTALGIDDWTGTTGTNISGTADLAPLDQQAAMLNELFPDAKTVGLLYCSAEPNSKYQIDTIKPMLEEKGYTCEEFAFADSNDVASVTTSACAASDVIYIPTDNTAASCTEAIRNVVVPAKTPVVAGEQGICSGCGVATLSIDYHQLGEVTGEMAYDILVKGADPATMEIKYAPDTTKMYNADICQELGITPPDGYTAIEA